MWMVGGWVCERVGRWLSERCGRVLCEGRVIGVYGWRIRVGRVPVFSRVV